MKRSVRLQAGDTIVEVIIAIAVVATTLAGAFVLTNKSTQYVRDSEEHAAALQLLQGQVESLRAVAGSSNMPTINASSSFCFNSTTSYPSTDALCNNQGAGSLYDLKIECLNKLLFGACPNLAGTTAFKFTASWPGLNVATNTVFLYYKVDLTP